MNPFLTQARNQAAHTTASFLSIGALTLLGAQTTAPAGAFIGLSYGILRELTEYHCAQNEVKRWNTLWYALWLRLPFTDGRVVTEVGLARDRIPHSNPFSFRSITDIAFWTLGGLLGGLLF